MVTVSTEVDKLFRHILEMCKRQDKEIPVCFVLGMDKQGIVSKAVRVRKDREGCCNMPTLSEEAIAEAMVKLLKDDVWCCGLARVGAHIHTEEDFNYSRGDSLLDLFNVSGGNGFMITMTPYSAYIDYIKDKKRIVDTYIIQTIQQEEVIV
jgi:hypothetical protein